MSGGKESVEEIDDAEQVAPAPAQQATHVNAAEPSPGISRRLLFVFALSCGLVVANLYYAQPMLAVMARDFHTSSDAVGQIVTLTQIGYAAGLLLLVPLGDLLDRRRLVVRVLLATAAALTISAMAPSLDVLIAASLLVGLTSVVVQVLVPFAASLANNAERGRVVGTVMSGLLIGVLLSRTFAGLVSQVFGWRAVYGIAAALMVLLIVVLRSELPQPPKMPVTLSYGQLLRSVGTLMRTEPLLRRRSLYGALAFAAFSVLWTSIAFLLVRPPYSYGQAVIGLFGLVGAAGALTASIAGRWSDRGWARAATGGFLLVALVGFVFIWLGQSSLVALLVGIVLLDLGAQGTQVTNQGEIYRLHPEARSRITTAYMVSYFIGGSVGSATSAVVYAHYGWAGVSLLGAAFIATALVFWLTELRPAAQRKSQAARA